MINALAILLACQTAGELLSRLLGLPFPGPVLGMVLLFAILMLRRETPDSLNTLATGLLTNLGLLFVPAGVGIIAHGHRLAAEWLAISAALLVSSLLTILVGVGVFRLVSRLVGAEPEA
jgi:holin-like protein